MEVCFCVLLYCTTFIGVGEFLYVSFSKSIYKLTQKLHVSVIVFFSGQFFTEKYQGTVLFFKLYRTGRTIFYLDQNQFSINSRYFDFVLLADFFQWHFLFFYYPVIDDSYHIIMILTFSLVTVQRYGFENTLLLWLRSVMKSSLENNRKPVPNRSPNSFK